MKTFAELKAEQVALNCRGQVRASHFHSLKSSNNLLATYRQISVQDGEPVFIKCAGTSEGVAKSWETRKEHSRWFDNRHNAAPNPNLFEVKPGEDLASRVEYGGPAGYHSDKQHSTGKMAKKFLEESTVGAGSTPDAGYMRELKLGHGPTPEGLLKHMEEHDSAMHASKTPEEFEAHKASREAFSATDKHGVGFEHKKAHQKAATLHEALGNSEHAEIHRDYAKLHAPREVDDIGRSVQSTEHNTDHPFWMK